MARGPVTKISLYASFAASIAIRPPGPRCPRSPPRSFGAGQRGCTRSNNRSSGLAVEVGGRRKPQTERPTGPNLLRDILNSISISGAPNGARPSSDCPVDEAVGVKGDTHASGGSGPIPGIRRLSRPRGRLTLRCAAQLSIPGSRPEAKCLGAGVEFKRSRWFLMQSL